jgi:UV excision repair protein RAD23
MAQNPAMVQPLLQQLAASNPGLAQLFTQNPDALLQLLGVEGGEGEDGQQLPPGTHIVNVTEEERAAIQRVSVFYLFSGLLVN